MKQVKIQIFQKELINDISRNAFLIGDVLPDDMQHAKHQIQDMCEKYNLETVIRFIETAYNECRSILRILLKSELEKPIATNVFISRNNYEFTITLPTHIKQEVFDVLPSHIHNYIVWKTLYSFLLLVSPEYAKNFAYRVEEYKELLQQIVVMSNKIAYRKSSPF